MRTPQAVKDEAKEMTDEFKSRIVHLGPYNGYEAFVLEILEDVEIGFPEVYLYKEGEPVFTVCGPESFEVMNAATKATRARRKAARLAKMNK